MSYLVDTDWIINAPANKRGAATVLQWLNPRAIAVSLITLGELYEVAYTATNPQARIESYRGFLRPFRKLGVTETLIERFSGIRALLRRRGQLISDLDILIAATALEHDLTLLTFNVEHFQRIPDL